MADLAPILIAYDGSGCADAAIDKVAAEFAGRKVVILVVTEELDRIPFAGSAGIPIEPETMEVLIDSARSSATGMAEKGAERARGERMVRQGGQQDSQDDRRRLAIARRQHQREQLRLVADLGDGDHGGRDEKCFHRGAFAQKDQVG